jgi:hypothetical protein
MRLESAILLKLLFDMGNKEKSRKMYGERAHVLLTEEVVQYDQHYQVIMSIARVIRSLYNDNCKPSDTHKGTMQWASSGCRWSNEASLLLEEIVREAEIVIVTAEVAEDTKEHTVAKMREEL